MGFNTKIQIDDQHVVQGTGTTLTLKSDATTKYNAHPDFTEDTQLVDKKYVDDNIISGVTSGSTYDGGSPATVCVGGLPVDTTLTGLTSNEILECILYPSFQGTLTDPEMISVTFSESSPQEVGATFTPLTISANFDRGSIDPQYDSACAERSGPAVSYCFTGAQTNGEEACIANTASTGITYTMVAGNNTWGSCTCYSIGTQPIDNKGVAYDSPLPAGEATPPASGTIVGLYPYFYGESGSAPTAGQALLSSGTKVVADSDNQIDIPYPVASDVWLWFAIPATSTVKEGWYEASNNNGNIGSASDLFGAAQEVSVDSPTALWSSQAYDFYIANWSTDVIGTDFCMTNTPQQ